MIMMEHLLCSSDMLVLCARSDRYEVSKEFIFNYDKRVDALRLLEL